MCFKHATFTSSFSIYLIQMTSGTLNFCLVGCGGLEFKMSLKHQNWLLFSGWDLTQRLVAAMFLVAVVESGS